MGWGRYCLEGDYVKGLLIILMGKYVLMVEGGNGKRD